MAFTESRIFRAWVTTVHLVEKASLPTGYDGMVTDALKCALFATTTTTPDRDATTANTGFNTGTWTQNVGNEKIGASEWVTGGRVVPATKSVAGSAGGVNTFTSSTNLTGNDNITMTDVGGCLIYDDEITAGTVADQGICYLYFGGAQAVTNGTFSVNWNASGIFTITV